MRPMPSTIPRALCAAIVCALLLGASVDGAQRGPRARAARQAAKQAVEPAQTGEAPESGRRQPQAPLARGAILARAIKSLNLTPQQARALREVRNRNDARMREIGRRFLDGRRHIDEILFADTPSIERARASALDLSKISGERVTARSLIELELFQLLTPEQRAELRQLRDKSRDQVRDVIRQRQQTRRGQRRKAAPPPPAAPPAALPQDEMPAAPDSEPETDASEDVEDPSADLDPEPAPRRGAKPGKVAVRGDLLARMALTPEQQIRFRQMRRQRAPILRDLNFQFRATQRDLDDALLADKIDPAVVRRLAEELGRIEADREMARFETEAGIRQILTPAQAALLRESRRLGQDD